MAIGHVRSNTLLGIQQALPELEALGVEVWPISRSLAHVVAVDEQYPGATVSGSGDWVPTDEELLSKQLPHDQARVISDPTAGPAATYEFKPDLQWAGWYRVRQRKF